MYRFYTKPEVIGTKFNQKLKTDVEIHSNAGRIAVAGSFGNGILKIAVSRCSDRDIFRKKTARAIAEGRLRGEKLYSIFKMEECSIADFTNCARLTSEMIRTEMEHNDKVTPVTMPVKPYQFVKKGDVYENMS